jgi:hypothetical protein
MVSGDKIVDPADHGAGTQPVTAVATGSILKIKHTGQGNAVRRPTSSIFEEIVGLSRTRRRSRLCEMVSASNEARLCSLSIVIAKAGINVCGAFGSL